MSEAKANLSSPLKTGGKKYILLTPNPLAGENKKGPLGSSSPNSASVGAAVHVLEDGDDSFLMVVVS